MSRKGGASRRRPTGFGRDLRQFREHAGLTPEQAAEKLKKSRSYISRIEQGSRVPKGTALLAIAEAYSVHPEYVLRAAHSQQLPLLNALIAPNEAPKDILKDATPEEQEELRRYLAFLRLGKAAGAAPRA